MIGTGALARLAWRNLWRQPRRTGLTVAAVVFAVALTMISLAMAEGSHRRWIEQVVRLYPGHVQVSLAGYREHRTLDYGMQLSPAGRGALDAVPGGEGWVPRLETFALAIPDRDDSLGRAVMVVGVDPGREQGLSRLGSSLESGHFLDGDPQEVILGAELARNLDVDLGERIILFSTDYYGSQAAERYAVAGTLRVGDPRFDSSVALVRLDGLQRLLEYEGGLSHVALFIDDGDRAEGVRTELVQVFAPDRYDVLAWPDLVPEMVQFVLLDDIGAYLTLGILITVAAFGILNTILMSVFERVREFGVMRSLGVRPSGIFTIVLIESILIALIGVALGMAIAVPIVLWYQGHPIEFGGTGAVAFEAFNIEPVILFLMRRSHVVWTPIIIVAVSLLAALPPAIRASRGRPVDALREV